MNKQKNKQINKCQRCQFYDKETDSCKNGRKNCSKTDFSKCTDYLIDERFVMF